MAARDHALSTGGKVAGGKRPAARAGGGGGRGGGGLRGGGGGSFKRGRGGGGRGGGRGSGKNEVYGKDRYEGRVRGHAQGTSNHGKRSGAQGANRHLPPVVRGGMGGGGGSGRGGGRGGGRGAGARGSFFGHDHGRGGRSQKGNGGGQTRGWGHAGGEEDDDERGLWQGKHVDVGETDSEDGENDEGEAGVNRFDSEGDEEQPEVSGDDDSEQEASDEDEEDRDHEEGDFNTQEGFPSVGKRAGSGGALDDEDAQAGKGKKKAKSGGFESMGFSYPVYRGIKMKGYRVPTPIQRKTIPLVMRGHDVVAMARTGSGKTAAFLLPMFERLKEHSLKVGIRGLILAPTRELALQTLKFAKELGKYTDLRLCLLVGGDSMEEQFAALARNPDVVMATPGRLLHHLEEVGLTLASCQYLVFDECDRLFEMGFAAEMRAILKKVSDNRQTLLFSATLPSALAEFARAGLKDPELVRLDVDHKISDNLRMGFFTVRDEERDAALLHLVQHRIRKDEATIVFVATKHHVEYVHALITAVGCSACMLYGAMDPSARKIAIGRFRAKLCQYMVVTDVAARGVDIPLLENVINHNFPTKAKLFVHRVGRAARAGRAGTAYSLVSTEELPSMIDLHLFLGKPLLNVVPEDDQDSSAAGQAASSSLHVCYGRLPQSVIDDKLELVLRLHREQEEIRSTFTVCQRALALYKKTVERPSQQSVRRAKQLADCHIHPWMLDDAEASERSGSSSSLIAKLQNFRPAQSVLEIHDGTKKQGSAVSQTMRKQFKNAVLARTQARKFLDEATSIKEALRELNEIDVDDKPLPTTGAAIKKKKKKVVAKDPLVLEELTWGQAAGQSGLMGLALKNKKSAAAEAKQRDLEQFYMMNSKADAEGEKGFSTRESNVGKDRLQRIEEMVLEMDPDDEGGLVKKRGVLRWDKRKKKFIKDFDGNPLDKRGEASKRKITESGRKVDKGYKTGLYEKWKDRSKAIVQREGEDEDKTAYQSLPDDRGRRYRHNKGTPNVDANGRRIKSELKTKEQIKKDREKRKDLKEKNLPKAVRRLKEARAKAASKPKPHGLKPHITKGSIRKLKSGSKKKK